jgi:hypothetical protein
VRYAETLEPLGSRRSGKGKDRDRFELRTPTILNGDLLVLRETSNRFGASAKTGRKRVHSFESGSKQAHHASGTKFPSVHVDRWQVSDPEYAQSPKNPL